MKHITIEDAELAWTVGVIAFDIHKQLLMSHSVKTGIQYEVRHYSHMALYTSDLSEAVDYYNRPVEPPEGWVDIIGQKDQTREKIAAIEAMGYYWNGKRWKSEWDK